MVALCCLVESASACWWVAESDRDGLGEKIERFQKRVKGILSTPRGRVSWVSEVWWEEGASARRLK